MKTDIGSAIRRIRKVRGLSQAELAKACGMQASAICHYEKGRREPSLGDILKLAHGLNATMQALIDDFGSTDDFQQLYDDLTAKDQTIVLGLMREMKKRP